MKELEIRIGYFEKNGFNPTISSQEWNEFKTFFSLNKDFISEKKIFYIQRVGKKRLICRDRQCVNAEYNVKTNRKNVDDRKNNLRIASAIETIEKTPDIKNVVFTFRRIRYSYTHKSGDFRVDITKDFFYKTKKDMYNVEFELLSNHDLVDKVKNYVIQIRKTVDQTVINKLLLVSDFNNLITGKNMKLNVNKPLNYVSKFHPLIRMTNPTNLTRYKLPFLKNYVFFPKLDGVHYLIYFHTNGVFYINDREIIRRTGPIRSLNQSVFLGELVEGKMYLFDALFFKNKDLRQLHLFTRLDYAKKTPIPVVEFFRTPLEAVNFSVIPTDGIICVPTDQNYINRTTYKWKPPSMLTIDFHVKFDRKEDGKQVYKLYNYNKEDDLQLFEGSVENPFSGEVILDTNKYDETITEFKWSNGMFYPERIRDDRLTPNFISVAQKIWQLIQNPITVKELTEITVENIGIMCKNLTKNPELFKKLRYDYEELMMNFLYKNYNSQGNILFEKVKSYIPKDELIEIKNFKDYPVSEIKNVFLFVLKKFVDGIKIFTVTENYGEVGLPGGKVESRDVSIISAMKREFKEETGFSLLSLQNIRIFIWRGKTVIYTASTKDTIKTGKPFRADGEIIFMDWKSPKDILDVAEGIETGFKLRPVAIKPVKALIEVLKMKNEK